MPGPRDRGRATGSTEFNFPDEARSLGWRPVDQEEVFALREEIERELPLGHRLKGHTLDALARREDSDDVLYRVGPMRVRFAVIRCSHSLYRPGLRMRHRYRRILSTYNRNSTNVLVHSRS